ncbi:MAG TPA: hypothetical protein VHI73_07660 [Solirubrobacteraceae bacterium]|jgi:hypothetical protein|nr:hypothetical protein [Solirubrobacteraceae bacterium]
MERLWISRLRWRMRGAWMWPAFAALTVLDALLVHARPISGEGTGLVPALLLACFLNLVAVAVGAPIAGALLRRRRRDLPRVVAHDYAGTALLVAVTAALVAGGAAHRPAVLEQRRDLRAQDAAVRAYVLRRAPPVYRGHLGRADTRRIDRDLYRTCVPGDDPRRALCVFVDTAKSPPAMRLDPNRETNQSFAGRRSAEPGG